MENLSVQQKKAKHSLLLIIAIILFILALVFIWLVGNQAKTIAIENQAKQEEFYAPYWINDSTMHMNISDGSCLLFQLEEGYCYVTTNNIDYAVIDADTLKMMYHSGNEFIYKAIQLDTIKNLKYKDIFIE